jgi:hypothetical protein
MAMRVLQVALQKLAKELLETRGQAAAQQQQLHGLVASERASANPNPSPNPSPNPHPSPNPSPSPSPNTTPTPTPTPNQASGSMVTALETRLKHVGGMAEEHGRYLAQVYLLWLDLRRLYEYLLRLYLLWQIGEALFAKNAVAHRFRTGAVVPSFAPPPAGSGTAVRAGAAAVAAAEQPPGFGAYATGASPSPTPTPTLPLTPNP